APVASMKDRIAWPCGVAAPPIRISVPSLPCSDAAGTSTGSSTRGTPFSRFSCRSRTVDSRYVFAEGGGHLRFVGHVIAQHSRGHGITASLDPDLSVAHETDRRCDALIAPRHVVVHREDRHSAIEIARVILQLPLLRRADDRAVPRHRVGDDAHEAPRILRFLVTLGHGVPGA